MLLPKACLNHIFGLNFQILSKMLSDSVLHKVVSVINFNALYFRISNLHIFEMSFLPLNASRRVYCMFTVYGMYTVYKMIFTLIISNMYPETNMRLVYIYLTEFEV